jgi:DNA replication protein DnaC
MSRGASDRSSIPDKTPKVNCHDPQQPDAPCPICGGLGVLRLDVDTDHPDFGRLQRCPNNPPESDVERLRRLRISSNLGAYLNKTFESFIYDNPAYTQREQESLQYALSVAYNFAQQPNGWLLLEGSYGTGKTHLAAALGNLRLDLGDQVFFITAPDLLDHLRTAFGPSAELTFDELFERLKTVPLLIIDDLGTENPSNWAREKLFQLINHRHAGQLPTVVTTNVQPSGMDPRIRSRLLDASLVHRVHIDAPDYRMDVTDAPNQLRSRLYLHTAMTLESFDTGSDRPDERENLAQARRVAQRYAESPEGWLILLGDYGTGKTHLAAAIAQYRQQQGDQVVFLTVPDLLDYLRTTFSPQSTVSFDTRFQQIREVDLLVLDDLSTENASPWAREKLFQIIDHRYVARRPTIITSVHQLEEMDRRLVTRLIDRRVCQTFALTTAPYVMRRGPRSG